MNCCARQENGNCFSRINSAVTTVICGALAESIEDFVCEPHAAVEDLTDRAVEATAGQGLGSRERQLTLLNMVAEEADANRQASAALVREPSDWLLGEIERLTEGPTLFAPARHPVLSLDVNEKRLKSILVNAHTALAQRSDVLPDRIGIVGHSFGGKWALFASCLCDKFACAVWSDPGIVFDERDRRKQNPSGSVNYWDVWYLGFELGEVPDPAKLGGFRKLPSEGQARTGAYKRLVEGGHDLVELHALMAPRPFLVSGGTADLPERWPALSHAIAVNRLLGYENRVAMTNRESHGPSEEANEQVYKFFQWWLGDTPGPK
jgi:hypothetical protein